GQISNPTTIAGLPTSQTNLLFDTNYQYQVESINGAGSAFGGQVGTNSSIDCTLGVTLTANNTSGTAPLASVLTATPTGTVTGTPSYRFKCSTSDSWSASQSGNTYSCNYPIEGSYIAWTEVVRGGKTATASLSMTVSATPKVDLKASGEDTSLMNPLKVANGAPVSLTWTSASISTKSKPCTIDWVTSGNKTRDAQNTSGESVIVTATTNIYTISCTTVNNDTVSDSVYINTAPSQPSVTPTTPTDTNSCGGKINLAYTAGTGATSYKLSRSPFSVSDSGWGVIQTETNINSLRTQDTGLTSGTSYSYQVEAINSAGSSFSLIKSAIATVACIIPPNVDLKINGKDNTLDLKYDEQGTITWVQKDGVDPTDPPVCTASGSPEWSGGKTPQGDQLTEARNCTTPRTYSISCENSAGKSNDSVKVNITSIEPGSFELIPTPSTGTTMVFYGSKATSGEIKIVVTTEDICDEDDGKNIKFDFDFLDPNEKKVDNVTIISNPDGTLSPDDFDTGITVQVSSAVQLTPGMYKLTVKGTRNSKPVTIPLAIQVIVIDPNFNEF
ncbi:MAG: hypothetical protein NUV47_02550, partial [Patescibacteria group bacterium]|nr:hypothetical protein [Patescibacteria group bacterium]